MKNFGGRKNKKIKDGAPCMKGSVCEEEIRNGMKFFTKCGSKVPKYDEKRKGKKGKKRIVVRIIVGSAVVGILLAGETYFFGKNGFAKRYGTLSEPKIVSDLSMKYSGQKVTRDCVWFGS